MAMKQLQSELLKLLSRGKNNQDSIISEIDEFFNEHDPMNIKKWRNFSNKKNTLLHELVEKNMPDVVRHIVRRYQFDINIKRDSDGLTPWQLASQYQYSKMCNVLRDLGADEIDSADSSQLPLDDDKERAMNIVWLDLEMTSVDNPEILECAVIITDKDLHELARKNWVIHFGQDVLDDLSDWHQKTFADVDKGGNGLFADIVKSKLTKNQVEKELLTLLKCHCPEKKVSLAGSSVHIYKEALKLRMPKVHDYLHYRIIDVTTLQALMRRWTPWMETQIKKQLSKKGQETINQRAMDHTEWSVSFMKEFRPIMTNQQSTPHNPKHESRKSSPRKDSASPSAAARNQPLAKSAHGADNKIQLYADEKRLLERLDHERKFNVKSLNLIKKDQQIYDANPHLREIFINNQQLTICHKTVSFQNRFLKLSSEPFDNSMLNSDKISTVEHWGQRKLLLVEIEFLTTYAAIDKFLVVYAGAAPGLHIHYLSRLFPHLEFDLIDANEFVVKQTDEIHIQSEKFTDDLAKRYGKMNRDMLFICNVRTFNRHNDMDKNLMNDMMEQMEWHKLMKPHASLLNFRLPRTADKVKYLKGDLVIEPWTSKRSMECRLIVGKEYELIEYDRVEFENSLLHFHNDNRIRYYEHEIDEANSGGLDHCYDCCAEIYILEQYLYKTRKVRNGNDCKDRTAQMSLDISKEIVDKKRESYIGVVRTLKVIPKK